jgi:hypothetical protein
MRAMLAHVCHALLRAAVPPLFAVAFGPKGARVRTGPVPSAWLADCNALAREFGLARGTIDAVRLAGRVQLRFSPDVPAAMHQRFRNVFGTHAIAR